MRALGSDEALEIVASQQFGVLDRTGLTRAQVEAAAWTVADGVEGPISVGGARAIALAVAVGRTARWPVVAWRVPGFGWLADRVYSFVARHRHRLPGEAPWCIRHAGECESSDS